jgi:hypothetical protein
MQQTCGLKSWLLNPGKKAGKTGVMGAPAKNGAGGLLIESRIIHQDGLRVVKMLLTGSSVCSR